MKVYLDPGHGGLDPGAVHGAGEDADRKESHLALAIARKTAEGLRAEGYEVKLSREADINPSLKARTTEANEWGAKLFISIHCNSFTDDSAHGIETLHWPGSAEGRRLAHHVQAALIEKCHGRRSRGLKERDDLAVLRDTRMPAILVECEFLSNPKGRAFLLHRTNHSLIAAAIAKGVGKFASNISA